MYRSITGLKLTIIFWGITAFLCNGTGIALRIINQEEAILIAPQLQKISLRAFSEVYKDYWSVDLQDFVLKSFNMYFERFQNRNDMVLIVAMLENNIGGWILFCKEKQQAIIELICVDPSHWRQGVGRQLIDAIKNIFPDVTIITVVTQKINLLSPSFYEALGFRKTNFMQPEYSPDEVQGYEWTAK